MATHPSLAPNVDIVESLEIEAYATAQAEVGAEVDLQGFEGALILIPVGLWTDATHTFTVTECDTSGGTFTAVAAEDLLGTLTPVTSTATDQRMLMAEYRGSKRFIKITNTVTGSPTTGAIVGAFVMRHHARHMPVTSLVS
jgi:hypothetical protein